MQYSYRKGLKLDNYAVAKDALLFERRQRQHGAVAANDVYPITFGGAVKVCTRPSADRGPDDDVGAVPVEPIACSHEWIAEHTLLAFKPGGTTHDAAQLLAAAFGHRRAGEFVKRISKLADGACAALASNNFGLLAQCVRRYRVLFNEWTEKRYLEGLDDIDCQLCGLNIPNLAWKPPGAGGSEALIVLVPDFDAHNRLTEFLTALEWSVKRIVVTHGVDAESIDGGRDVRITAGHRIDFIGAADLGADGRIRTEGRCCACAIEPRREILKSTCVDALPIQIVSGDQANHEGEFEVGLRAEVIVKPGRCDGGYLAILVNPADNAGTENEWWVQQQSTRQNDGFHCTCQFGEGALGLNERFVIVAVAVDRPLKTGDRFHGIPSGKEVGRRVVRRTR